MHKYALIGVLLTLTGNPLWLWTRNGCVHLPEEESKEFIGVMNKDLGGCSYRDRTNDKDFVRWYQCSDGGNFYFFWEEKACKSLHEVYIKGRDRGKGTL